MKMLIEHLPGLHCQFMHTTLHWYINNTADAAEWILNRCVLEKYKGKKSCDGSGHEEVDGPVDSVSLMGKSSRICMQYASIINNILIFKLE